MNQICQTQNHNCRVEFISLQRGKVLWGCQKCEIEFKDIQFFPIEYFKMIMQEQKQCYNNDLFIKMQTHQDELENLIINFNKNFSDMITIAQLEINSLYDKILKIINFFKTQYTNDILDNASSEQVNLIKSIIDSPNSLFDQYTNQKFKYCEILQNINIIIETQIKFDQFTVIKHQLDSILETIECSDIQLKEILIVKNNLKIHSEDLCQLVINYKINENNNCKYNGQINNNQLQGIGLLIDEENQNIQFGNFIDSYFYEGIYFNIKTQDLYSGQFSKLQLIEGKYINKNQEIFIGKFKNNKIFDKGKCQYPNGDSYEGEWIDGLQHGFGVFQSQQLGTIKGHFIKGLLNGEAHIKCKEYIYDGEFKDGEREGNGESEDLKTQIKYKGGYLKGLKSGNGQLIYPDGSILEGSFLNDQPHGMCKFRQTEQHVVNFQKITKITEEYGQYDQGQKIGEFNLKINDNGQIIEKKILYFENGETAEFDI